MRQYTASWQTFEQAKPAYGSLIVVETPKGCVTGEFKQVYTLKIGKMARFFRKNGEPVQVSAKCRWYPQGSERLKVKTSDNSEVLHIG